LRLGPLTCRATPTQAAAAPFFYITPKIFKNLIDKYNSRKAPIESMAPIGKQVPAASANIMHVYWDLLQDSFAGADAIVGMPQATPQ
jgi:hypothetical protein